MTTCWRCGVEFDASRQPASAPCRDCRESMDTPGAILWASGGRQLRLPKNASMDIMVRRQAAIRELWALGMTDQEISRELGISARTALRWRHKMSLSPNSRGGQKEMTPERLKQLQEGYAKYRAAQAKRVS